MKRVAGSALTFPSLRSKATVSLAIFLFLRLNAIAQDDLNTCKWISAGDAVVLDSLSVLPSSIFFSEASDTIPYEYDLSTGRFRILAPLPHDSVEVCYRTLPFSFSETFSKRSLAAYDSNAFFKDVAPERTGHPDEGLFNTGSIAKSGNISRGISVGNNQDVFVNSTLDLFLEGKLTDDLKLKATITDQNVPYQPEGNTQYVQDIDKILIQLYNDDLSLTAGDIVFQNTNQGFLRYQKRVQGALFESSYKIGPGASASTSVGVSAAKGKFASEQIEVQEGVSGPYKIPGPGASRYLYVVANSEKVYLDGRLLTRGYDQDYVIDYNMSEITFTPRVAITKYSRVRIDFEYADRNYSRSIISANHTQTTGRLKLFVNYFQEKDNPNQPLLYRLTQQDKLLLAQAGDNPEQAKMFSYDSVGYNENEILYKKTEATDGETIIFKHSNSPDSAFFRVKFSYVGENNGNYKRLKLTGQGWVYEWVPPVDGSRQGAYEPVADIPAPAKKTMISTGGEFSVNDHESLIAEAAFSDHDKNLFSPLDSDDDKGAAYKLGIVSANRRIGPYNWSSGASYEQVGAHFNFIDRYRPVEFERRWNTPAAESGESVDRLANLHTELTDDHGRRVAYQGLLRNKGAGFRGMEHSLSMAASVSAMHLESSYLINQSENQKFKSGWRDLNMNLFYRGGTVTPGYSYRNEKNQIRELETDSLVSSENNLDEHVFYLKNNDTLATSWLLSYGIMSAKAPLNGEFADSDQYRTLSLNVKTPSQRSHAVDGTFSYRKANYLIQNDDAQEEFVSGSVRYRGALFNDIVRADVGYGIANGREQKREYIFLKTPAGEGSHTWVDENGDGVQDLDEFYEAVYEDERNYAKIFVPTDEFVQAYVNDFDYRVHFQPPAGWRSGGGAAGFISRFTGYSLLNISRKTIDDDLKTRLLPFDEDDPHALSYRKASRHEVHFNRTDPVYGLSFEAHRAERRQALTSGFEEVSRERYGAAARLNLLKNLTLRLRGERGFVASASDFLDGRDFSIKTNGIAPELEALIGRHFRASGKLDIKTKSSLGEGAEGSARFNEAAFSLQGSAAGGAMLAASLRFINIDYVASENAYLEYEMLEALRPGDNVAWRINIQRQLLQGLTLNLSYDGRKSEASRAIHFGRMQLTAFF